MIVVPTAVAKQSAFLFGNLKEYLCDGELSAGTPYLVS